MRWYRSRKRGDGDPCPRGHLGADRPRTAYVTNELVEGGARGCADLDLLEEELVLDVRGGAGRIARGVAPSWQPGAAPGDDLEGRGHQLSSGGVEQEVLLLDSDGTQGGHLSVCRRTERWGSWPFVPVPGHSQTLGAGPRFLCAGVGLMIGSLRGTGSHDREA